MAQIQVKLNPDVQPTGSDLAVVNAARRSFNTRSEWDTAILSFQESEESGSDYNEWEMVDQFYEPYCGYELRKLKEKDKRLIQFLARGMTADHFEGFSCDVLAMGGSEDYEDLVNKLWEWRNTPTHESPFGHCFFSFEIKVPLFLARQLVKHKFLRWSEYSRRYITDDVEFYAHDYREASENKKQGSEGPHPSNKYWKGVVDESNKDQLGLYNRMIGAGIAPEQARGVLPSDLMTAVTWSGSLDAFANMCRLRLGSDAQVEAQYVAKKVYGYLEEYCPVSARSLVYGC